LTEILTEMLSASDNLTAEMLTRELARQAQPTTPGTTAAGVQVVKATLDRLRVDRTGLTMVDGSGLSRDDRIRCGTLLALLDLARTPKFAAVGDGLSIAGKRGTLADRLVGTKLAGNLTAKTGTLAGVSALAGYVTADRPLRFAFIVEGPFAEPGAFAIREALATDIASYGSDFPDTAVPAPATP
jgi:D-alanyl-D-alanine carboxypeptidase/D-alanyl-D-alanine-endopeptidase (penicillin-binding protein 4)